MCYTNSGKSNLNTMTSRGLGMYGRNHLRGPAEHIDYEKNPKEYLEALRKRGPVPGSVAYARKYPVRSAVREAVKKLLGES